MLFANEGVSIHAPWEGCDVTISALVKVKRCFNSRTLGRVRRVPLRVVSSPGDVSIHAPWEGCDSGVGRYTPTSLVSIHAPWEGCDWIGSQSSMWRMPFQFTHPGKGATRGDFALSIAVSEFQFTHPGKGATDLQVQSEEARESFNSRTLGRVRRRRYISFVPTTDVSIHAPWEGCDSIVPDSDYSGVGFNSRTLGRVRPQAGLVAQMTLTVSIHAPWEGCDLEFFLMRFLLTSFNSRTLGRVRQCGAKVRIIGRINKRNLRLGVLS